jgi:SnoaL-like domain
VTDIETLTKQVARLNDLEDIKQLKYRYFRAMTYGDHDTLKETLTEDVVTSYSDGHYVFDDREKLLRFLIDSHDPKATIICYWMAGMPEISFQSDSKATGIWAMYHYFYNKGQGFVDEMFVYYDDEYRKENGTWRFCKTGYKRVINQILDRREMPYKLTAPEWAVKKE